MDDNKTRQNIILDFLIYTFFIIFLLSLGNSIFVNQVGYFGALILILLKAAVTKKNQFEKTGLELAFIFYILAEVISLILSEYPAEALRNLTKRAGIIPVFYTTIAAVQNYKIGKRYFAFYLFGMIATMLVYLFFAAKQYMYDLYRVTQSGPSVFQFPITTSEIMSFTVLFLFAFLINERTSLRLKIFTFLGFIISALALFSTFKRTGWIGTIAGIVLILAMTKRWKTLAMAILIIAGVFLADGNKSEVIIFETGKGKLEKLFSFETDGRAYHVADLDSIYTVSEFENGVSFYRNEKLLKNINLQAPVGSFTRINDSLFLASLYDTRLLILNRKGFEFSEINELLSPGYTTTFKVLNDRLYVRDADSGLTVFTNPYKNDTQVRYPELKFAVNFFADSSFIYLESLDKLQIRKLKNFLPDEEVTAELPGPLKILKAGNGRIFISRENRIDLLDNQLVLLDSEYIASGVRDFADDGTNLFLLTDDNRVIKFFYSRNDSLKIAETFNPGFAPTAFNAAGNKIYFSQVKRSRLLSIFDPYVQTNFTRFALWRAGWEMFKDNPLFGLGDVDLAKYYLVYKRPFDKEIHGHLHNNYFHFLATLGLFGFIALAFLFFKMFKLMTKHFKESKGEPFINSYSLGAIAGLACTLVSGLTELNFWDQEIATLVYFTAGLSAALYNRWQNEMKTEKSGK